MAFPSAHGGSGRPPPDRDSNSNHLVQFYDTEDFLCDRVAEFLGAGLSNGDPLLVIATEARIRAFLERLEDHGFEVETARRSGRLALLDVHGALDEIMAGPMPDERRFQHTIQGAIEKIVGAGEPVRLRAYGEMVDILSRAANLKARFEPRTSRRFR